MKMYDYLNDYKHYLKSNVQASDNTIEAYSHDINRFIDFLSAEGVSRLEKVDNLLVRTYITKLRLGDLSEIQLGSNTISRNLSSLRSFYYFLIEYHSFDNNPFLAIKSIQADKNLPDFLYYNEVEQLLDSILIKDFTSLRNRLMLEMMYGCGLRVSEVTDLTINNVNTSPKLADSKYCTAF